MNEDRLEFIVDFSKPEKRIPGGKSPTFNAETWCLGGRHKPERERLLPEFVWWDDGWYLACFQYIPGAFRCVEYVSLPLLVVEHGDLSIDLGELPELPAPEWFMSLKESAYVPTFVTEHLNPVKRDPFASASRRSKWVK